jgi:hypothetical protein
MSPYPKPRLVWIAVATSLLVSGAALAENPEREKPWPADVAVETAVGQRIPVGAQGVALIDAPREASLLNLRGISGSGAVVLRTANSRDCLTVPVRFVAGDFGGNSVSTNEAKPIRLILQSLRVATALAEGRDVVSDMYRVTSAPDDVDADILIASGLSESHGFVLNPGISVLADIFGAAASRIACLPG